MTIRCRCPLKIDADNFSNASQHSESLPDSKDPRLVGVLLFTKFVMFHQRFGHLFADGHRRVQRSHGILEDHRNFFPRIFCSSFSDFLRISVPLNRISPLSILALLANNPMILRVVTDFPLPDSPTIASVSPLYSSKLTSRIAWTFPAKVSKEISKFSLLTLFP